MPRSRSLFGFLNQAIHRKVIIAGKRCRFPLKSPWPGTAKTGHHEVVNRKAGFTNQTPELGILAQSPEPWWCWKSHLFSSLCCFS